MDNREAMKRWFHRVVLSRRWTTFVVLGLSFLVFGASSVNLLLIAKANADLILEHGWQALADGAAQQLVEILATAYLSMVAYVVFKACEARLVRWLADPSEDRGS